jgi:hypothetical protein
LQYAIPHLRLSNEEAHNRQRFKMNLEDGTARGQCMKAKSKWKKEKPHLRLSCGENPPIGWIVSTAA